MSETRADIDALRNVALDLEIATDDATTTELSHDWWIRGRLQRRSGKTSRCAAVVRPSSTEQVSAVLAWADRTRTAIVPFGLGSGVCGAIQAESDQIVLDMSAMNRVISVNDASLTATVQPGMRGSEFEAMLARRGLTMGHFPQSIELSTVGGWCSTRASGQLSTRYGNIEDMLLGCEVVLPGGRVVRLPEKTRAATGPDLKHLFLGAEGTLGVFTELTFRVLAAAEAHRGGAYAMPSVAAGCEALRRILRSGWKPAVTRLYDAVEAGRNFNIDSVGRPALLLMSEGPAAYVEAEMAACEEIVVAQGGEPKGAGPVESWMQNRNHVPDVDQLIEGGLSLDTIEVAIAWDGLADLFAAVCEEGAKIDGMVAFSGHVSHCYTQGANIYFTFVAQTPDPEAALAVYDRAWELTMTKTHELGGTIAHHHGIGRVRKHWLAKELGEGHALLAVVKRAIDPNGIMNPGALIDAE
jgi:alkyldihydroxyacetonephosphate synthase